MTLDCIPELQQAWTDHPRRLPQPQPCDTEAGRGLENFQVLPAGEAVQDNASDRSTYVAAVAD